MVSDMTTALHARHVHVEPVMGTVVSLDVRGAPDRAVQAAFDRVMAWLRDVDRRFSTYRADSEISRLDRGELSPAGSSTAVRGCATRPAGPSTSGPSGAWTRRRWSRAGRSSAAPTSCAPRG
jgi:hypothetical protein